MNLFNFVIIYIINLIFYLIELCYSVIIVIFVAICSQIKKFFFFFFFFEITLKLVLFENGLFRALKV